MATDVLNNPLPSPSISQYPEMIMAAIDALNEPNGSTKPSISKQIESMHADLPADHSKLLSEHLNNLKNSGDLVFVKNNYMKPDSNAPPKRGRGRPPKPKESLSPVASESAVSPRPRGRPPKQRELLAPISQPKKVSARTSRPRGRPLKDKAEEISAPPPPPTPAADAPTAAPRGRGRPPKVVKAAVAAVVC